MLYVKRKVNGRIKVFINYINLVSTVISFHRLKKASLSRLHLFYLSSIIHLQFTSFSVKDAEGDELLL